MSSGTTPRQALTNDELMELLQLLESSDSVELKVTAPESALRSTAQALGLDPLDAQIRQVYFFDTPDLVLDAHGLVARARRIQGKGGDSTVKLRPVVPAALPESLRALPDFRVEVDALPGGFVCSGALKHVVDAGDVRRAAVGDLPLKKLFSKEQRRFFAEHAPDGVGLDDLSVLGPILVLKLRFTPPTLGRRMVAELWFYPDGSQVLELSTRAETHETFDVAAKARAFLASAGVDSSGKQQTKTRKALDYFASALQDKATP